MHRGEEGVAPQQSKDEVELMPKEKEDTSYLDHYLDKVRRERTVLMYRIKVLMH